MSEDIFIGVDGGGTKTEFVGIDASGRTLARHRGSTTYHLQIGVDGVERTLADGFAALCGEIGIEKAEVRYVFVGLPAYGEDSVHDPLLDMACARVLGDTPYRCDNDMVCGWAGSLDCSDGINLVAGTGSIGYGRRGGREARVGGWGELFSDEGSAYWIAVQGFNAFSRMSDGRLPMGPLHAILSDALALDRDLDLCARTVGKAGLSRDEVAAWAPLVPRAADLGDPVAEGILAKAAEELAAMAATLRNNLGYRAGEQALISWSGGVLSSVAAVREALRALLPADAFTFTAPRATPAEGAARYARLLAAATVR